MTTMTYRDFDTEKVLGFSTADAAAVRAACQTSEMRRMVVGFKRAVYDAKCDDILVTPAALTILSEQFGFTPVAVTAPSTPTVAATPVAAKKVVYEDLGPDEGAFAIGSLHMGTAIERVATQPVRGETMVCPCCRRTFAKRERMMSSRGTVCPRCYDRMSE